MARRRKSKEELEELTRTQVLNLKELEKAAKYEKKTSKKPAAVFALFGVFSISLGLCYPGVSNMLSSRDIEETPTVSEQRQENVSSDDNETAINPLTLTCTASQTNTTDATLVTTTYTFQFQDTGVLTSYKKVMNIKAGANVTQTPSSIVSLDTSLTNLMQTPITGYLLEKAPTASTTPTVVDGYTATLTVDFTKFNPATLTALHTSNSFARVEFASTNTKDAIQQKLTSGGYTCQ